MQIFAFCARLAVYLKFIKKEPNKCLHHFEGGVCTYMYYMIATRVDTLIAHQCLSV